MIDPEGRSLAYHVRRLKAKLEELRERLREATARLLSETVADVVQQVVRRLLATPLPALPPAYRPAMYDPDTPPWARPDPDDDLYDPQARYERNYLDETEPEPDPEPASEPETAQVSRWRQALAVGLRAAAWWLQRWTGRSAIGTAVGVGVTATAVVLAGGPWTMAGAGLLASALGLSGLVALIHSGAALLAVPGIT
jgi:hypothetical protein